MEQQSYEMFKDYPDVVGIDKLCEMLHIGRSLAYRIVCDGTIPAKKLGREFIIAKIDIIEYVLSKTTVYHENIHDRV